MDINLEWQKPIVLKDGSKECLIFNCNLEKINEESGIYIFARRHGNCVAPLYIGQAINLRTRIKQQLNTTKLMKGLEKYPSGKRIVLIGILKPKRAQKTETLLNIVERAYIENALSEGHDLLNKKGTKISIHTIKSDGKEHFFKPFPRTMKHQKR